MTGESRQLQAFARWSDETARPAAVELAERHRELAKGRLPPAQLAGLHAIAQSAREVAQVTGYTQHQAARARRAGRFDVEAFWRDTGSTIDSACRQSLRAAVAEPVTLAREVVGHLAAHLLYLKVS